MKSTDNKIVNSTITATILTTLVGMINTRKSGKLKSGLSFTARTTMRYSSISTDYLTLITKQTWK